MLQLNTSACTVQWEWRTRVVLYVVVHRVKRFARQPLSHRQQEEFISHPQFVSLQVEQAPILRWSALQRYDANPIAARHFSSS